jgi:hypothetical protein
MINYEKIADEPETIMFCDTEDKNIFHEFCLDIVAVSQDKKQITFDLRFVSTMMGVRNRRGSLIGYTYCKDHESTSDSTESLGKPI